MSRLPLFGSATSGFGIGLLAPSTFRTFGSDAFVCDAIKSELDAALGFGSLAHPAKTKAISAKKDVVAAKSLLDNIGELSLY